MRAPVKLPKPGRVPVATLQAAIIEQITAGVSQAKPMATNLGWSVRAVSMRLQLLADLGEIHRTSSHSHIGGLHYHWHLGPHPDGKTDDDSDRRIQIKMSGDPVVVRPKTYADIGRRDYLVAALFGAAPSQGAA